jgi:homoserine kinase
VTVSGGTGFVDVPVTVRVPATSANLGPGFDALGLALELFDDCTAQITAGGLSISVEGDDAVPTTEQHLVVRSMRAAFDRLGAEPAGLALHCRNRIPHARGLGSSAAAIVAGILLARALVADGASRLGDDAVLALAADLEGHADNVAACLLGGLTIAWHEDGAARAVRLDCDPRVRPVVLVPSFSSSTKAARGMLPASLPHRDAAFNTGRSALLVAALVRLPDALFAATEDRLHQPFRVGAVPQAADLIDRLRTDGLAAVMSGAGPTVLVLARDPIEVESAVRTVPDGWRALAPAVSGSGAVVTAGIPDQRPESLGNIRWRADVAGGRPND